MELQITVMQLVLEQLIQNVEMGHKNQEKNVMMEI